MVFSIQQLSKLLAITWLCISNYESKFWVGAQDVNVDNYTIINGQIFTPGLAIVDAPQPNTPEGGDFLQVALDVSYDGALSLPPYSDNSSDQIHNITIFLYSYDLGNNFTITNGTASANNASLGDIMEQEPGSTVKHVNWVWPACLVGDGGAEDINGTARGIYNISIHQSFRLNGTDYYTIFDLPIAVTNSIPEDSSRASCSSLNNSLIAPSQLAAVGPSATLPYAVATQTSSSSGGEGLGSSSSSGNTGGLGGAQSLQPQYALFIFAVLFFSAIVML